MPFLESWMSSFWLLDFLWSDFEFSFTENLLAYEKKQQLN